VLLVLVAAVSLVAAACGDDATETSARDTGGGGASSADLPHVVVTTTILGDVVAELAGDQVRIDVLMPIGADPHDFAPSAQQAALVRDADLVVANGLALEIGLEPTLDAAAAEGVDVLTVAELVDPLPFAGGHDHGDEGDGHDHGDEGDEGDGHDHGDEGDEGDGHDHGEEGDGHDHGELDPHFWQDAARMAVAVGVIAEELAGLDGVDAALVAERAEALAEEYVALDAEVAEIVSVVPDARRSIVTNHDSLGYFADRYGFEVVGVIIPGGTTLAEPSARELADLADLVTERDLPAIFAETTSGSNLAEALAAEVGRQVAVVSLFTDSLGPDGSGAETYAEMMRTNAQLIADALG